MGGHGGVASAGAAGAIAGGGAGGALSGGVGGTASIACPADVPVEGSPCPLEVGRCTWGNAPLLTCRTSGNCTKSGWQLTPPRAYCTSTAPDCDALIADGSTCSDTSPECLLNDTSLCWCTPCNCEPSHPPGPPCAACPTGQPLGTLVRFCRSALTLGPPCPPVVPNVGAPCDSEGMACPPSACQDTIAVCTKGVWQWTQSNLCPVCASPNTPIATPLGERPIADLRVGDLVYSVDNGAIVPVPLIRVGRTAVTHHQVVRVVLDDGRSLEISAGHPTADGRTFGDLRAGGRLDGHELISAEIVPYSYPFTYDVLPGSNTGTYFAAGALIGSTLDASSRTP
ncbi:MAG TPA: Hint domain-containing protein [Polyangiaceae bacterium]|nr:Hint domain-containing protein [Polyangiaceae bacterium]